MIKNLIVILILFVLIDFLYLYFIAEPLFQPVITDIQGTIINLRLVPILLTYILLAIGIYYFSDIDPNKPFISALLTAGLFGFIVYGVFDLTNFAIFEKYKIGPAIIDIIWGTFLCTIVAYLSHFILN